MITASEFADAMAPLGPFEASPRLAAGVSGGPDSMALALLADAWARQRGGALLALIVDHGLRQGSDAEAAVTAAQLAMRNIAARVLTIQGLVRGPGLARRARDARFRILTEACARDGILHIVLGHHSGDQAETVLIRSLGGSGPDGLAGIAALVETAGLRVLRPLLGMPPARLRVTVTAAGMTWVEDPSNHDPTALRPRLRLLRFDHDGGGSATSALLAAAAARGRRRTEADRKASSCLAARASLWPEGYSLLSDGPIEPRALAALLQTIGGAPFPPPAESVATLAAMPRPATLAGVRLLPAGRLGPGFLVVREAAAMASSVPALPGATWDGRFRLASAARPPVGATFGALGSDAARLRRHTPLPAVILQTLPAIRHEGKLLAVPHLLYPDSLVCGQSPMTFSPPRPAAAAPFLGLGAFGDA